jgi:MoxR-like ATPase
MATCCWKVCPEQEGTYPLPEAQRDRFLLHIMVRYPSDPDELKVMRLVRDEETEPAGSTTKSDVIHQQTVFRARAGVYQVAVAEAIERYIVALIAATRRAGQFGKDLRRWRTRRASRASNTFDHEAQLKGRSCRH